jgi:hypothetical protein
MKRDDRWPVMVDTEIVRASTSRVLGGGDRDAQAAAPFGPAKMCAG